MTNSVATLLQTRTCWHRQHITSVLPDVRYRREKGLLLIIKITHPPSVVQGQVADVLPSDVVGDSNGSDDGTLDLGDGLAIKSAIAERLFQFQLTGMITFPILE